MTDYGTAKRERRCRGHHHLVGLAKGDEVIAEGSTIYNYCFTSIPQASPPKREGCQRVEWVFT